MLKRNNEYSIIINTSRFNLCMDRCREFPECNRVQRFRGAGYHSDTSKFGFCNRSSYLYGHSHPERLCRNTFRFPGIRISFSECQFYTEWSDDLFRKFYKHWNEFGCCRHVLFLDCFLNIRKSEWLRTRQRNDNSPGDQQYRTYV